MAAHTIQVTITANGRAALATTSQVKAALNQIKGIKVNANPFTGISKGAREATSDVNALSSVVSKVRNTIIGAFAVDKVISFGKSILEASANTELLHKGLAFVLGSDEEASRLVSNIQAIGEASAYDTNQLLPLARAWVNIGDNVDTATSKMSAIVDLGSAYGLTADQVGAVNLALTQMQMAGKIGQQDMMQLINAGIPGWQLLSEKMGIPVEQLKDMSSKGELTQEAMSTLWDAITEKTNGAASSMADTLMGKFSNAEEAVSNSMSAMGDIVSQAFDVPGILDQLGELAEGFKGHMTSIRDAAKNVGVKEAIVDELEKINPTAAKVADGVMTAFGEVKDVLTENSDAVELVVKEIMAIGGTIAVIKGVQGAFAAAEGAAIAFRAACAANPILLAISAVIAILVLLYQNWDWLVEGFESGKEKITAAMDSIKQAISEKIDSAVATAKAAWQGLVDFISHPIDTTINVVRKIRTFNEENRAAAQDMGYAQGGVFGMARGGLVGGLVPLANGGQLKNGTPAIVGEAGPEAVIPLRDDVLAKIGKAIIDSYTKGRSKTSDADEIRMKISSQVDKGPVSQYAKVLEDAEKRAQAVGEAIAKFNELQDEANKKVAEYAEGGDKAVQYQQRMAELASQIANLQKSGKNPEKLDALVGKQNNEQASYEKEKAEAIKAAQDLAAQRESIETDAANAIAQIRIDAENRVNSRSVALKQAQAAMDQASTATSLSEFQAMMAERDEITGESYATTLANETALQELRRGWHDELMTNAMSWSLYMQESLANVTEQLQNGIAQGLAQCVVYGKDFSDTMRDLAGNVLSTLLQSVIQKAISSLGIIGSLTDGISKKHIANAMQEKMAEASKTATIAANATGAYIAANPWAAFGAAAIVAGQMAAGAAAGGATGLATGGLVSGPGTSTSDSIPAMLSDGEYVLNAAAVQRVGTPYLNMINSPHYADGGQVGTGTGNTPAGGNLTLNISTFDAASFDDFLRNGGGDIIKQRLYDNDRNFATDAGVW